MTPTNEEKFKKLRDLKKELVTGDPKKNKKQKDKGKMTARERIDNLLDERSFVELDRFVEHREIDFGMENIKYPGDAVITGFGTVDGRTIFIFSHDFTRFGGSLGEIFSQKVCRVMDLALKAGTPIIGINDSGGARIQEGVASLGAYGEIFFRNADVSGVIPQISAIMGPCAGGAVYSPAVTDFIFMVEKTSHMFITGPDVIKTVTGEEISFEDLGGARTHCSKSGVADFFDVSEIDSINRIRKLLSFLPSNNVEDPPYIQTIDSPGRKDPGLNLVIPDDPNKPYDVKDVIQMIFDKESMFEVAELFAQNVVIAFARLNGHVVGIVANQPNVLAGTLDIDASDKIARFVRFCDCFNIPLITLMDVPGFLPGIQQEYGGIIRHGAKIMYAYAEATVPQITIITRKAYGGAYVVLSSINCRADIVFAWPTAEIAVMGPEGAANIIFRKEIKDSSNPDELRKLKVKEYKEKFANPYVASSRGYVNDIIEPMETRPQLIATLNALKGKRKHRPPRKHGNIPL
ncbi:MAG: putative propionyl-CoA carboxylase beta chain 5 [Candidatus Heimdallarchaeota archaeon LC_3]|nr:MAG: putative propionyl-CoA carboxylase beta chain 5 [Candidatus Heimdallarchaeota archaeon LC_3]